MTKEFEYMRYGGKWDELLENLDRIRQLPHKLTFNMIWCILNHTSIFDTVDYFISKGFHQNGIVLTAIFGPGWLDCRHLPNNVLQSLTTILQNKIASAPGYLLEDGYRNLLKHIQQPIEQDLAGSFEKLAVMDQRRGVDSSKIFTELYKLKEGK